MMGGDSWSNTWFSLECDLGWHCYACQTGIKFSGISIE